MKDASALKHQHKTALGELAPGREIKLYKSLLRIRTAEETPAELYKEGEMRTPTHFGNIDREDIFKGPY